MNEFFKFADRHPWIARSMVIGAISYTSTFVTNVVRAVTGNYPPAQAPVDYSELARAISSLTTTVGDTVDADESEEKSEEDTSSEPTTEKEA